MNKNVNVYSFNDECYVYLEIQDWMKIRKCIDILKEVSE